MPRVFDYGTEKMSTGGLELYRVPFCGVYIGILRYILYSYFPY